jgi:hypothetical protein
MLLSAGRFLAFFNSAFGGHFYAVHAAGLHITQLPERK